MSEWLEDFWGDLLSEEPARVIAAWKQIDPEARVAVREHLQRMATEDGWADGQRDSARVALHAIDPENTPRPG